MAKPKPMPTPFERPEDDSGSTHGFDGHETVTDPHEHCTVVDSPEGAVPRVGAAALPTPVPPDDPEVRRTADLLRKTTSRVAKSSGGQDLRRNALGARSFGRYALTAPIGSGGCGTVYRAWDPKHEREVAVKVLARAGAQAQRRFDREVKAIARLRHPGIVPLLDSGQEHGCLYLVMELVRGQSLAELAHDAEDGGRPLAPERLVTHVRDAARAIEHAHGQGVLHRDIKPHNLLVDEHGHALVVDFGLAWMEEDEGLTRTGAALGTPAFMPPEQAGAREGRVDVRSDVYALGATLFYGLTAQSPFEHVSGEELFLAIFRRDASPPSRFASEVPPELDAIVLKCLEKDPARRYPSAAALADDLDRFLAGEPVSARRVGAIARAVRWMQRNRLTAGLILGLLTLLATLLVLFVRYEDVVHQLEAR